MIFFDLSFWQSFLSNLGATLIGAAIGVFGALWLNNHIEKQTEKERKKKILRLLKHELLMNIGAFSDWQRSEQPLLDKCARLNVFTKSEYWKAFSDGGELKWIKDPVLLSEIAEAYNFIRMMLSLSDRYFQLLQLKQLEITNSAITNVTVLLIDGAELAMREIENGIASIKKSRKNLEITRVSSSIERVLLLDKRGTNILSLRERCYLFSDVTYPLFGILTGSNPEKIR